MDIHALAARPLSHHVQHLAYQRVHQRRIHDSGSLTAARSVIWVRNASNADTHLWFSA
jgi:hypothetical protein